MTTDKAKRMTKAIYFTIFMVGVFAYLQNVVTLSKYPLELLTYILAVSASIKALCVAWISYIYFADEQSENNPDENDDETINEKEGYTYKGWYTDSEFIKKIKSIKKGSINISHVYASNPVSIIPAYSQIALLNPRINT